MEKIWKKIGTIVITILATLGVLFIILLLMPEDPEDKDETAAESEPVATAEKLEDEGTEIEEKPEKEEAEPESTDKEETDNKAEEDGEESDNTDDEKEKEGNTVKISIPESDISSYKFDFKTLSLDNEELTEDIFSDYDITIVYLWGTYCPTCIAEMGDFAEFYDNKPDNVNLVGLIADVYDGLDNNVSEAEKILSDVDAEFINMRSSDSLYEVLSAFSYVPSFLLVNRDGYLIGTPYVGRGFDSAMEVLEQYYE
ncbi:MAG: TlpA family protein disulfide reductase [Lachnospiraceae bacterium]|nr:TlpA family protein disulfide reductase [Lachnospiraceae bacterium]